MGKGGTTEGSEVVVDRPLAGLSIAITRPVGQAEKLADAVRAHGGTPVLCPTIRVTEGEGRDGLRRALERLKEYQWVVFTSANGVASFWSSLEAAGAALPAKVRVAAIGPATARALQRRGVEPEVVPDEFVAEAVAETLIQRAGKRLAGQRILLPRAAGAREVLPERLRAAGARVEVVAAYESVPDPEGIERLRGLLAREELDVVTFTAASTVRSFVESAGSYMGRAVVAAIGPITAAAARELGVGVDVVADRYTIEGLVAALCDYYRTRPHDPEGGQGTR